MVSKAKKMPPNTTTNPIESISEQFQKLDLKALAREKGAYQVYPKTSVSIVHFLYILSISYSVFISILLLNQLSIMIQEN